MGPVTLPVIGLVAASGAAVAGWQDLAAFSHAELDELGMAVLEMPHFRAKLPPMGFWPVGALALVPALGWILVIALWGVARRLVAGLAAGASLLVAILGLVAYFGIRRDFNVFSHDAFGTDSEISDLGNFLHPAVGVIAVIALAITSALVGLRVCLSKSTS